ncbi:MAG: phosphoheptose isomerase [Acidobacteria bacterium RIFCSPLOWO2_02_FULL_61_28]|nr:MAG: phosphoheptose isomerase [Acidobacteria bacterium RIFCSPLOWO2_02_FULL_61_28]
MAQNRIFDDISARVSEVLAKSPAKDIEKNLRGMLSSAFSRLDLVTREEFDVQAKVLARTREKLVALEARVAALEEKLESEA